MTERELERRAQRRLAVLRLVEKVSGSVAATCRYYGISRQCHYGWLRRYEADVEGPLQPAAPLARHHSGGGGGEDRVAAEALPLQPGEDRLVSGRVSRCDDLDVGVWRILKRLGINRLPASQRCQRRALRWKQYEKQRPGHQLQVDVKFIEPLGQKGLRRKKYYQFTAIDDCTRLRVLRAYPRCDQKTAIAFIDDVMAKLPFAVERVQTDNGSESAPHSTGTCSTSASTTSRSNPGHPG